MTSQVLKLDPGHAEPTAYSQHANLAGANGFVHRHLTDTQETGSFANSDRQLRLHTE
jgi:hypothetical protein